MKLLFIFFLFTLLFGSTVLRLRQPNTSAVSTDTLASSVLLTMTVAPRDNVLGQTIVSTVPETPTLAIPSRSIYLGMWTQGFWDDAGKVLHPEALVSIEEEIGKQVAIAHYYRGWEALAQPEIVTELQRIDQHGWRPMISANPYYFDRCPYREYSTLYKTIASGHCDPFLHDIGKQLHSFGKPVFLRFAWEMNIPSMEWSVSRTGDTPEDFISAWQHIHAILTNEQAQNVLWVFSPNVEDTYSTRYDLLYPGDAAVDWLGLDGYNWGTTQSWSSWQPFAEIFTDSYHHLSRIAPTKPIMIAETNSTDRGGDKAAWYRDMLDAQLPYRFPAIKALVWYNEDRTAKEQVNWRMDVSPEVLLAVKNSLKNPLYRSTFPHP